MNSVQLYENTKFQILTKFYQKSRRTSEEIPIHCLIDLGLMDENGSLSEQGKLFKDGRDSSSIVIELSRWHAFDRGNLIDREVIRGNIIYDVQKAEEFMKAHSLAYKRNYAGGCYVHYCYPLEALEQGLWICLMKGNFLKSNRICIDIFQNRIEFSFSSLKKDASNIVITNILKLCQKTEGVQSSFIRIERCYQKERKRWRIVEKNGSMKIMLENTYYRPVRRCELKKLRPSAKRCYFMILENPGIQLQELAEKLNRPYITAQTEVRNLRKKQLVERRGKVMTGGYYCIEFEPE